MRRQRAMAAVVLLAAAVAGWAPPAGGANVAVFNFQMKSDTPEWGWVEKFLADQITTDFVQAGGVQAVARDRMQEVAGRVGWAAERTLADAAGMETVRKDLRIEYVVTGVYSVRDGRVEVSLQIVRVKPAWEVFRKSAAGATGELVAIQKQLAAEAIGWFQSRPAAQVLPTLTVWTRSLPALKAMYEGMHLYDQGRYAEAWLRFRQANRADGAYVEADYWTAKMYYFMDRYEHARRALEAFVYRNPAHPRVGEAVLEYLHTYEARGESLEELLELYGRLARQCPNVLVRPQTYGWQSLRLEGWLRNKTSLLLCQAGRYRRSLETSTFDVLSMPVEYHRPLAALAHFTSTGKALPEALIERAFDRKWVELTGEPVQELNFPLPVTIPIRGDALEPPAEPQNPLVGESCLQEERWLRAPEGYSIASLRAWPDARGEEAVFTLRVVGAQGEAAAEHLSGLQWQQARPIAQAVRDGVAWGGFGPQGWVRLEWEVAARDKRMGPPVYVKGIKVEARLERVGPWGTVDVVCRNTPLFAVDLDGKPARRGAGLIGPVPAGKHTLTFRPLQADAPLGPATLEVSVVAGRKTAVAASLPWAGAGAWAAWRDCLVPDFREGHDFAEQTRYLAHGQPAMVVDETGIRLIWARHGDLWFTASTDGRTFSPPRRIALPVSSGWIEEAPLCIRDESGRYVMLLQSDRNWRHKLEPYVTWSRDFEHWSAPAMVDVGGLWMGSCRDLVQDAAGRYLLAGKNQRSEVVVLASADLLRWEAMPPTRPGGQKHDIHAMRLAQRPDGVYQLFTSGYDWSDPNHATRVVACFEGKTPAAWESASVLWRPAEPQPVQLMPLTAGGRSQLVLAQNATVPAVWSKTLVLVQQADGTWSQSRTAGGLLHGPAGAGFHPRWGFALGYLAPWLDPTRGPDSAGGPFLLRGPDLAGALGDGGPVRIAAGLPAADPPEPETPIGQLQYVTASNRGSDLRTSRFEPAAPNSGVVSPKAFVATVTDGVRTHKVALDWTEPKIRPNIARVDLSGAGRFDKAMVVQCRGYPRDAYNVAAGYYDDLTMPWGKLRIPVSMTLQYNQGRDGRTLSMDLGFGAHGYCRFGEVARYVVLLNSNGNAHLGDPWKALTPEQAGRNLEPGDRVYVEEPGMPFNFRYLSSDHDEWLGVYWGQPVHVGGKLFTIELSEDKATVLARPYAGPAGMLRVNKQRWFLRLERDGAPWMLTGGPDPVPVPAGTYRLTNCRQYAPGGEEGRPWVLVSQEDMRTTLTIAPGQTATCMVGAPLTGQIEGVQGGRILFVRIAWKTEAGLGASPRSSPMTIVLTDAKGKPLGTTTELQPWRIPEGLSGRITLSPGAGGPVDARVSPATIELAPEGAPGPTPPQTPGLAGEGD